VDSSSTDDTYMKRVCGVTPKVRPAIGMYYLIMVLDYVWPVVILGITTSPADVQNFYWNKTVWLVRLLRLDRLILLKEVKQPLNRSAMVSSMSQFVGDEEDVQVVQAVSIKPGSVTPMSSSSESTDKVFAKAARGVACKVVEVAVSRQEHKQQLTGDVVVYMDSDGEVDALEAGDRRPRGTVVVEDEDDLCSVETLKS